MRVVIHKVIQLATTNTETGNNFARVKGFLSVADSARGNDFHNAVGQHLTVDPQVFVALQVLQRSTGNFANPKLQRCAIFNQHRHVLTNTFSHAVDWRGFDFL